MADIVLLFVLKGRDCMSKVLIEVLVIILIAGSYLILYSADRVSAMGKGKRLFHSIIRLERMWHHDVQPAALGGRKEKMQAWG